MSGSHLQEFHSDACVADRSKGMSSVPGVCRVVGETITHCNRCHNLDWGDEEYGPSCQVVLRAAVLSTSFTHRQCRCTLADGSACPGLLVVDGKEYGLLRATEYIAFGHELLYHWSDRLAAGQSDTWSTSWLLTIMGDKTLNLGEQQDLWKRKGIWANATLDFLQLMNRDYHAGFSCNCWQGAALGGMIAVWPCVASRCWGMRSISA